ncbi:MAG: GLPGLI family protein [Polaribacter sp.]
MKSIITAIAVLFTFSLTAQNFQGKATYKTSRKSNFKIGGGKNDQMSDDMMDKIKARMSKMNQKTFILDFNKYASSYKEEVNLAAPKPSAGSVTFLSFGGPGNGSVYYKNTKEKRYVNQTEIQGKRFLVKDKLPEHKWEMSSETKNIGKYTCYKATYSKEVDNKKISFVNGETKEVVEKKTIVTTAWYTPQVPVSNGPKNYQGLPGLILEINDGTNTIVCTEIVLDTSGSIKIEEPKKGKVVSQKEFTEIRNQKSKEMLEKFKSRKGVDMGNGVNVKFSGN